MPKNKPKVKEKNDIAVITGGIVLVVYIIGVFYLTVKVSLWFCLLPLLWSPSIKQSD